MASVKAKFRPSVIEGKEGTVYYQIIQNREGVSKFSPSFFMPKAPTFTSWGFVIT